MACNDNIYVIIPVYNAENYVSQAIESVLAQPYDRAEIICVDDGSHDNSLPILKQYAAKYPNIHVIHQENSGVSAARNTGVEYVLAHCSDHDYLTFLDADDLMAKDAMDEVSLYLQKRVDCIGFSYIRCTEDLSRMCPYTQQLSTQSLVGGSKSLWCHKDYPMGAVLYSCSFLKKYNIRFIDKLNYAEDSIFKFTCFFLADQIIVTNKIFYCYRMHSTSSIHSRKFGIEYMPAIIAGYLRTVDFLKPYENQVRGYAKFCSTMAGIHGVEMAAEHYQQFHSKKSLQTFLAGHPQIVKAIQDLDPSNLSDKHRHTYDLYVNGPRRFQIINYFEGVRLHIVRILKMVKPISKMIEKNKYPLKNIYV